MDGTVNRQDSPTCSRLLLCAVIVGASTVLGCAGVPAEYGRPQVNADQATPGLVFGRIVFVIDGKEKDWGTGLLSDGFRVAVRSLDGDVVKGYRIKGDGSFVWSLPPGQYVVAAYAIGSTRGRLWVTFSVPSPGIASYLGDLHIAVDRGRYTFGVEDNYAAAVQRNLARLNEERRAPAKELMRPEKRLGTYTDVWGICSQRGGVQCSGSLQGVEAVGTSATPGYPLVATLTPVLEWKPSTKSNIRYDFALYEVVGISSATLGVGSIRGPLVAYAEGLREPRYQVSMPLEPGKKYEWSVRLRDGDTVSNWSSSSYFLFLGIAYISGWGQWFGFSTPAH